MNAVGCAWKQDTFQKFNGGNTIQNVLSTYYRPSMFSALLSAFNSFSVYNTPEIGITITQLTNEAVEAQRITSEVAGSIGGEASRQRASFS